MRKLTTRQGFRLLLAVGICLGTLASVGAANEVKETAPAPEAGSVQEEKQPVRTEEELKEAADRQKRAAELLARRGVGKRQRDALAARMGGDEQLFLRLERGELTRVYLTFLALPNGRTDRLDRYAAWAVEHPKLAAEEVVLQVNMNQDQDFYSLIWEAADPAALDVLVNKHYILPAGYAPELEALGARYGSGSLRPEAAQAFRAMADGAKEDGISLRSVSAYQIGRASCRERVSKSV